MVVQTRLRRSFTVEEILAGKHSELTREQREARRRGIIEAAELTRGVRLPVGYVQHLIRSGRDDPERDSDARPGGRL